MPNLNRGTVSLGFYSRLAARTSPTEKYGNPSCCSATQPKQLLVLDWQLASRPQTLLKHKSSLLIQNSATYLDSNMASRRPVPTYTPAPNLNIQATSNVYRLISESASSASARVLESSFTIRQRSGQAWIVPAGHVCRLTTPKGPQVGDLNIWNANNPRERLWSTRTRQIHASHVSVGDRLWSNLPYLRPLVSITGDSLGGGQLHEILDQDGKRLKNKFGPTQWGGRVHDLMGTRCDPYVNLLMGGESYDFHCHSNLTRAVIPFGLTEFDVHDVINVFQVTGLDEEGRYFMETSPARPGEYFEFFAEVDVLCALSTCPGGMCLCWAS